MSIQQFFELLIQKIHASDIPDVISITGTISQSDKTAILSHLRVCQQIVNADPKYRPYQKAQFKASWIQAVKLIKKHIPGFFDEFAREDEVREQIKELIE